MARWCLHCGQSAYNSQNGNRKLLGVLRRSHSMGHLQHYNPGFAGQNSGCGDEHVFDDLECGRQRREEEHISFPRRAVKDGGRRSISNKSPVSDIQAELDSYRCRPNLFRETKNERLSSITEIVEDEDKLDANVTLLLPHETKSTVPLLPETQSTTSLLSETKRNQEAYCIRDDSSEEGSNRKENDTNSTICSPTLTEYYSCLDDDQRQNDCMKDNLDANVTPLLADETKSSPPLLPETKITISSLLESERSQEAYRIRDDSSEEGSNTKENDSNSIFRSPTLTGHFRCRDVVQRKNDYKKVPFIWILIIGNFICELVSAICEQLSSPHKSVFALIAMVASFVAMGFCLVEIVCKFRQEKVTWRKRGKIYWFYDPNHKRFGSFKDMFGLVCATLQFISVAIGYAFYRRHVNSPVKLSLCSVIFAFCLMCSKFCSGRDKQDRD